MFYYNEDKTIDARMEEVVEIINIRDKKTLKSLFSKLSTAKTISGTFLETKAIENAQPRHKILVGVE